MKQVQDSQSVAKRKALDDTITNIEKQYGKGTIMRLGDKPNHVIDVIPTGCISLDYALGVGGIPRGRIIEIYGPEAGGKCVVENTWVLTRKGLSKIGDFKEEDTAEEKFTPKEVDLYTKEGFKKTDAFYNGGLKNTIRVTTNAGFELEGTNNHPVYILDDNGHFLFRRLEDLKDTDYVCIQRNQNVFSKTDYVFPPFIFKKRKYDYKSKVFKLPKKMSKDFARFIAYVIAEGGQGGRHNFNFTNTDVNMLKDFERLSKKLFGYSPILTTPKDGGVSFYEINSSYISSFLKEHEILRGVSKDKVIPKCILHSSKGVIQEFLTTFFDCEGYSPHKSKGNTIELSSASKELSEQLQLLLLNFGIFSKRTKSFMMATNGSKIKREYWNIHISDFSSLKRFQKFIGFKLLYKKNNLSSVINREKRCNNTNTESIPYAHSLLRSLKKDIMIDQGTEKQGKNVKGRGIINILGEDLCSRIDDVIYGWCNLSYAVLKRILKKLQPYNHISSVKILKDIYEKNFFFDKVVLKEKNTNMVYDFSVPQEHSFFSNGFLSHNTTMSLHILAECQKRGGVAAFVDAEHALDTKYAKRLGVNTDDLLLSQPDYGEQALEIVDMLVHSHAVDIIVIDSVAALVPKSEIEGDMGDPQMAVQARLMSQALRKLTGAVAKSNTCVIFINQLRDKIGVIFGNPETTTGGNALKFYASVRLDVRRVSVIKKEGKDITGNKTRIKVVKNKVAPPFREVIVDIVFGEGIDSIADIIELASTQELVKKAGGWYTYGNDKFQGDKFKEFLKNNPDVLKDITDKLREKLNDNSLIIPTPIENLPQ